MRRTARLTQFSEQVILTLTAMFMVVAAFGMSPLSEDTAEDSRSNVEVSESAQVSPGGPDQGSGLAVTLCLTAPGLVNPFEQVDHSSERATPASEVLQVAPKRPPPGLPQHV